MFNKIIIKYIYSIGFRCNSVDFLKHYKLRNHSGPFDNIVIDIESSFENISKQFQYFIKDIVLIDKVNNKISLHLSNSSINKLLLDLNNNNKMLYYMNHEWNRYNLRINQNFINYINNNLYFWDRICLFLHHNIIDDNIKNKLDNRCHIFNKIYQIYNNLLVLFHITKIITINDLNIYKNYIFNLQKKYNINCYIIIIVCSDRLNETHCFENNILFIVKKSISL